MCFALFAIFALNESGVATPSPRPIPQIFLGFTVDPVGAHGRVVRAAEPIHIVQDFWKGMRMSQETFFSRVGKFFKKSNGAADSELPLIHQQGDTTTLVRPESKEPRSTFLRPWA